VCDSCRSSYTVTRSLLENTFPKATFNFVSLRCPVAELQGLLDQSRATFVQLIAIARSHLRLAALVLWGGRPIAIYSARFGLVFSSTATKPTPCFKIGTVQLNQSALGKPPQYLYAFNKEIMSQVPSVGFQFLESSVCSRTQERTLNISICINVEFF
jgi:hypothetical protein